MRILPREKRQAMFDVYAFCRAVDDIADGDAHQDDPAGAMQGWRDDIDALYAGGAPGEAAHLAPHVAHYGLKREDFVAVIDGMDMDLRGPIVAPDAASLDLYCDRVASAVGRLSVRIFGMDD
ncbi:MAG: squalene/phytoene synthase family protein, partial [Rhodoblastus sp.]|nr:squalene/phytoene synthase family protein [Rhodoblastus sp.]